MMEWINILNSVTHLKRGYHILFKSKEQKIADARAEIEKTFQDFMEGEGRLPEGFSERYNRTISSGFVLHETPFKAYLDKIRHSVDALYDKTGISDWLYLDESVEINAAAQAISEWAKRHKEMNALLREKSHVGNTTIMVPVSDYCTEKIMIVIDDRCRFESITEESLQKCKSEEISFCTVLSDCKLYDLTEQKEKEITYVTYPNYHDETYADWSLT